MILSYRIYYRLGYLSGTSKAYEQAEDLLELTGVKKKVKEAGILKGRDLKDEKGNIYYAIYLISENKDFLNDIREKIEPPENQ